MKQAIRLFVGGFIYNHSVVDKHADGPCPNHRQERVARGVSGIIDRPVFGGLARGKCRAGTGARLSCGLVRAIAPCRHSRSLDQRAMRRVRVLSTIRHLIAGSNWSHIPTIQPPPRSSGFHSPGSANRPPRCRRLIGRSIRGFPCRLIPPSHQTTPGTFPKGCGSDVLERGHNVEIDYVWRVKRHEPIDVLGPHGPGLTLQQRRNLGLGRSHWVRNADSTAP